mmetsp:Transcript_16218/g.31399  ORF Transcript_16218/g.31399 Transcript_16218/m.31399 type:complete len:375 (-) Transcript_16218:41-1165(-)|eukprot:CAMPEP_0171492340 /NCGR_PEP_ID=MMETSP0958-20121227/4355_1 /TAXON_ID=87120 /ORGANISM="Aurantiochytrium limacinum, Strain ATCCMYA-1381" /LENGTH=374 /DNA_ID=CAMNT_0012025847 /DNA_START=343 /DNA_END=1467 /DNA_ORIENTATION=-
MTTTQVPVPTDTSGERSVQEQLAALTPEQNKSFEALKAEYEKHKKNTYRDQDFGDYMLLRFLRNSPGAVKFNVKTAQKVMKNFAHWSQKVKLNELNVGMVRKQLETTTLSIPGTRSKDGHLYLFMKPGLYFPKKDSLDELMRSLVYLLECMTELETCCTDGIAVMCDMTGWTFSNFGIKYAKTYFDTMQGRFPMRVRQFLIVNPPSWFGTIWKIIRPMMNADFAAKVKLPKKKEVGDYVQDPAMLPKEFGGPIDVARSLEAFITYRARVENISLDKNYHIEAPSMTAEGLSNYTEHHDDHMVHDDKENHVEPKQVAQGDDIVSATKNLDISAENTEASKESEQVAATPAKTMPTSAPAAEAASVPVSETKSTSA